MKIALVLALVGLTVGDVVFDEWVRSHGKVYESAEVKAYRQGVWRRNLHTVMSHNVAYAKGHKTYTMAMNVHGDLTHEEFRAHKTCFRKGSNGTGGVRGMPKVHYKGSSYLAAVGNVTVPAEIDFRKLGFVTKVKDQGQCGSCWAFSSTGALEGQIFRKTDKLPSLSEQQLVDCAGHFGNDGCDGGLMEAAFTYIMSIKGLMTEAKYPYTAEDGECQYKVSGVHYAASGFLAVPEGNETLLTEAIALNGPLSVAIDASQSSFQFYSKGVYNEPKCSSEDLDHGVLVAGYGVYQGTPYYLVKNSWGSSWGMDGYIMMSRNGKNQCGIASDAVLPLV